MNMAFIHWHACVCEKKERERRCLEVADYSGLIEEFFRNVRCRRGSKHWGTLREKWEEGGGPEGAVMYRM